MNEYNLCPICGGIKDPAPTAYPRKFGICRGHEPVKKHDGKLDDNGDYMVEYGADSAGRTTVDLDENIFSWLKDSSDRARLTPAQALSLRDWLIQESPELERLAKEQGQR